jgi:hypothetical protein
MILSMVSSVVAAWTIGQQNSVITLINAVA